VVLLTSGEDEVMAGKKNCWEFKNCGREPGGSHIKEFGVCPVATEAKLHGAHGGTNAGRACWVVAGTLCRGQVQGTFAKKFESCEKCDFYVAVREEEFPHFVFSSVLLSRLKT
jgi:hypothetical protein